MILLIFYIAFVLFIILLLKLLIKPEFPYYKNPYFLTNAEKAFFHALQSIVNDKYIVCCQVGLNSLVRINKKGRDWWITESYYEKKRKEYRVKQKAINKKIEKLQFADEEYYITSSYLLKLAENAGKLFESSEVHEKRLLLKMALQNLTLPGKKARYDWINPFNKIAFYASRQTWLPRLDSNQ